MAIRFVVGPPGSGKTHWCLDRVRGEAIAEPDGPPIVLLVPEQASLQTERLLLSAELEGTMRARVFSFRRLANWVWSMAPGEGLPHLGDVHRRVIVASIVARLRADDRESVFARVPDIDETVAAMIAEMKEFRVSCGDLGALAAELRERDPGLARKLSELALIASEYDARVAGRFRDPETSLASLRDAAARIPELQGARIVVDGFSGFTPVEIEVLRGLVRRAHEVTFALSIDPERFSAIRGGEEPDEASRTLVTEETAKELLALAKDEGVRVAGVVHLPLSPEATRFRAPELAHLAANFRAGGRTAAWSGSAPAIAFAEAEDEREEVRRAAEQLLDWRARRGWRWGEMAIIAHSLDGYALVLEDTLSSLGIPHFLDRHEPLETHPIVQGTLAALEASLSAWHADRILEFARAGLFPFDADDVAKLVLWVREYPRRAGDWVSPAPWKSPPPRNAFDDDGAREPDRDAESDLRLVDTMRRTIMAPLAGLRRRLDAARSAEDGLLRLRDFVAAICALLHEAIPDPDDADAAVLAEAGELLDALAAAGGDEAFADAVALGLLRDTFGRLALPRTPPLVDQVVAGEAQRSRLPTMKGIVVLGLAEGRFPPPGANASLLTDRERDELESLAGRRLHFRPSARRLFRREAFFALSAFAGASDALVLSRPLSSSGEGLAPSPWWEEARRLFPNVDPLPPAGRATLATAMRAREAAAAVCRTIFSTTERHVVPPPAEQWIDVLAPLAPRARDEFRDVVDAAARRNRARLRPDLARDLAGEPMRTSVSAIESFARCPFAHFMGRMIRPRAAAKPDLTVADVGNLAHAALKELADRFIAEERAFSDVDDAELRERVEAAFRGPFERLAASGLFRGPAARLAAEHVRDHVLDVAQYLAALQRHVHGRPALAEATFGDVMICRDAAPAVRLRGQIDHVEVARDASGRQWALVVDFKLSERRMKWSDAEDGAALQLPAYLIAVARNPKLENVEVAGAFYLQVVRRHEARRQMRGIASARAHEALALAADDAGTRFVTLVGTPNQKTSDKGDVIGDAQFARLAERTEAAILRRAGEILAGRVDVNPALHGKSTPCGTCDWRIACRLDYTMNVRRQPGNPGRAAAVERWLGPP